MTQEQIDAVLGESDDPPAAPEQIQTTVEEPNKQVKKEIKAAIKKIDKKPNAEKKVVAKKSEVKKE